MERKKIIDQKNNQLKNVVLENNFFENTKFIVIQ